MVVTKMPCLPSSIFSCSSTAMSLRSRISRPREYAFCPGPGKALDQQQHKNHRGAAGCRTKAGERYRKGQQKNRFHVKDEKDDGVEIVSRAELYPGVAPGLETALIDCVLSRVRFGGRKEPSPGPCN